MVEIKRTLVKLLPDRIAWYFSRPYIAGDSMQKAIQKVDTLWKEGNASTVDLLGEAVSTREEVEEMVQIYRKLIDSLTGREDFASISIKLSAMGVNISKEYCIENLRKILTSARENGIKVTLDMEDSSLTDVTLQVYRELHFDFPDLGTVLQSRLFRTENDIDKNLPNNGRIRTCIGIYREPASIALTNKREMKGRLVELVEKLIDRGDYVEVATHDTRTMQEVLHLFERKGIGPKQAEFQFLLGVPRDFRPIKEKGFTIRLYAPFAMHWRFGTAYVKRRFLENPHMGLYVARNLLSSRWVQLLLLLGAIGAGVLILILFS
ncbi:MAG TPA: proline dehydrogenase family protein [Candidatus Hodarchaeales archaeon]|nr:proline dehydrogenase family protein [Candidatus Hodarchaeales archaeon]